MGLFYSNNCSPNHVGYADTRYLSDQHKVGYQTGYVFISRGRGCHILEITKQSIVTISSNYAEIIAIMKKVENVCG